MNSITATTITAEKAVSAAAGGRSIKELYEALATTRQNSRSRHFRMTAELSIEIKFDEAESEPDWLVGFMERLSNLLNLPENWDSYGSRRISPTAVLGALKFILPN